MILPYRGILPSIGKNVFIAPSAVIIGSVVVSDGASVWFNAVVRGDMEQIKIGVNTNIQDNCTVHTDHNCQVSIGNNVTVGHNAIVHGCSIENNVLIGMGAIVLNNAIVKEFSIVAAGSIVTENQSVGPYHLVAGIPAVHKRDLSDTVNPVLNQAVQDYLDLSKKYIDK